MKSVLTVEKLRSVLDYDPSTGVFTWLVRTRKIRIGQRAGAINRVWGYRIIRIEGKLYRSARLAWLYCYGEWPKNTIDHVNCDRLDDRIENLRDATQSQNNWNMRISKSNTSGVKGVSFDRSRNRWYAYIKINNIMKNLGLYKTKEEAAEARFLAAKELHGQFARIE